MGLPLFASCPAASTGGLLAAGLADTHGLFAIDSMDNVHDGPFPERADILVLEVLIDVASGTSTDVSIGAVSESCIASLHAWTQRQAALRIERERRALSFLGSWSGAAGRLGNAVRAVYLEFDRLNTTYSSPSLFLRTEAAPFASFAAQFDWLLWLLSSLLEPADRERVVIDLLRVFAHPPEDCRLTYVGVMSRSDELLRVCVALPMHAVPSFLETLGRPPLSTARLLLPLAERAGWIDLGFGISRNGVVPKFGIELTPSRHHTAPQVLNGLRDFALAESSRLEAVSSWLAQPTRATTRPPTIG
jgi:hypothetical protein